MAVVSIDNPEYCSQRKLFLVLGMHRSGTSAIARALQVFGAHLGDTLIPPGFDNPRGFWEDRDILRINEKLLSELGSAYDRPNAPDIDLSSPTMRTIKTEALQILQRKLVSYDLFAIKDPRLARLLPFWKAVFSEGAYAVTYIIALRNPLSVIKSLEVRNGFDPRKSAILWYEHMLAAVYHTIGANRVIVDYDLLIENPERELVRVADREKIAIRPQALEEYKINFLDAALRHTIHTSRTISESIFLSRAQKDLYFLLRDCAIDRRDLDAVDVRNAIEMQWRMLQEQRPLLELVARMDCSIINRDNHIRKLGHDYGNVFEELRRVNKSYAETIRQIREIKQEHARAVDKYERLLKQNEWLTNLLAEAEGRNVELSKTLETRNAELATIRASRFWQLRDYIKLEPWSLRKVRRVSRLLLSLSTPVRLRRWRSALFHRCNVALEPLRSELTHDVEGTTVDELALSSRGDNLARDVTAVPINNVPASIVASPDEIARDSFDADFYLQMYPDLAFSGMDPLEHYRRYGRYEGRLACLPQLPGLDTLSSLQAHKDTVFVVCHEGSRTGAPILGYNLIRYLLPKFNVISFFLRPGPMLEECRSLGSVVLGPIHDFRHPVILERTIALITERVSLRFAIINSVEARFPLEWLARRHIPTVTLIHEFAANTRPPEAFRETVFWSGVTVFSSQLTLQDAKAQDETLRTVLCPVIPQGRCLLPPGPTAPEDVISLLRPPGFPTNGFVVLGLGSVHIRKGVDLFLECAARVTRTAPDLNIRFVWIGAGYLTTSDGGNYSDFLADQIRRGKLEDRVQIIDEVSELNTFLANADILLLTSRLDPLPNVAIDSLSEGVPVICFERATGIAEVLREHGLAGDCVAPYLDSAEMSQRLIEILRSPDRYHQISQHCKRIAAQNFQMSGYVDQIIMLAERQRLRSKQEILDIETILESELLQIDYALGPNIKTPFCIDDVVLRYVRSWACGISPRKPFPGFHPGIYREMNAATSAVGRDPLAEFIRHGRPAGPWLPSLVTPATTSRSKAKLKVALHVHAYYPEMVDCVLSALRTNTSPIDILVSVVNEHDRETLELKFAGYDRGSVDIRVVPNKGRDLGPFLTAFGEQILNNYDIVGHFHTKRSPHTQPEFVKIWVDFLLVHLLGDDSIPMADRILGAMADNKQIGIVFPDDPNISTWGPNLIHAKELAKKLGIDELPNSIIFPLGSMFWARVDAIAPLLSIGLTWDDYPLEPVPADGTMLHAMERIIPLVVLKTGHTIVLSHVPGVVR